MAVRYLADDGRIFGSEAEAKKHNDYLSSLETMKNAEKIVNSILVQFPHKFYLLTQNGKLKIEPVLNENESKVYLKEEKGYDNKLKERVREWIDEI